MSQHPEALRRWKEKLDFLLTEEASEADPESRFKLRQLIAEAREKIAQLEQAPGPARWSRGRRSAVSRSTVWLLASLAMIAIVTAFFDDLLDVVRPPGEYLFHVNVLLPDEAPAADALLQASPGEAVRSNSGWLVRVPRRFAQRSVHLSARVPGQPLQATRTIWLDGQLADTYELKLERKEEVLDLGDGRATEHKEMAVSVRHLDGRALAGVFVRTKHPNGGSDRSDGDGKAWVPLPLDVNVGDRIELQVRAVGDDPWVIVRPAGGSVFVPNEKNYVELVLARKSELQTTDNEPPRKPPLNQLLAFSDFKRGDIVEALLAGAFYDLEQQRESVLYYIIGMNTFFLDESAPHDQDGSCVGLADASLSLHAANAILEAMGLGSLDNPNQAAALEWLGRVLLETHQNPNALAISAAQAEIYKTEGRQDGLKIASIYGCSNSHVISFFSNAARFVRGDAAAQSAASGEAACHQLERACLARLAAREFARAAEDDDYRMRWFIADLSLLLKQTGLDASAIIPHLEDLDPVYRVEALAEVAYFGGATAVSERVESELQLLSGKRQYQYLSALGAVAAVEAASGQHQSARRRLSALEGTPQSAPALMHLAIHEVGNGSISVAKTLAQDALDVSGANLEYETLRGYFKFLQALAASGGKTEAIDLTRQLEEETHQVVAVAHVARGSADLSLLAGALDRARNIPKNKHYPMEEIAIIAGEMGSGDIALQAASAMNDRYMLDAPVIATAVAAGIKQDPALLQRARQLVRKIPSEANLARADALVAIAEALKKMGKSKEAWDQAVKLEPLYRRVELFVRLAGTSARRF